MITLDNVPATLEAHYRDINRWTAITAYRRGVIAGKYIWHSFTFSDGSRERWRLYEGRWELAMNGSSNYYPWNPDPRRSY
jgi:hypothetical protein